MTDNSTPPPHANDASPPPPLLKVRRLSKHFPIKNSTKKAGWFRRHHDVLKAVDNVSFDLQAGQTLGIVGESGSGKTTCARCILRAIEPTAGSAQLRVDSPDARGHADTDANANADADTDTNPRYVELTTLTHRQLKPMRKRMQMIFQDPYASLNPRMSVRDIVAEPLVIHGIGNKSDRDDRVAQMLERVGLLPEHMRRFPHAFSGGQRQRIGIARALILNPSLVVADEAVSALDVSVQARVLDLLRDLQQELNLTYIFVSHDLSVIRQVCDHVAVMYKGKLVELAPADQLFDNPRHAYTHVLMSAIPHPDPDRKLQPLRVSELTPEQLEPLPELLAS